MTKNPLMWPSLMMALIHVKIFFILLFEYIDKIVAVWPMPTANYALNSWG